MSETITQHDARTLQNPEADLGLIGSFDDWRVFAVSHLYGDRHAAVVHDADTLGAQQSHDGPTYIVVGSRVSDERLAKFLHNHGDRYAVTLAQLQAARAGNLVTVRTAQPANWNLN